MTNFSGTKLSPESEEALFGDIDEEEASAPEPDAAQEESVVAPEEPPAEVASSDEPPAEGESPPVEGEGDSPPEEPEEPEPALDSVDWKKRFDDLRSEQMRALEAERQRADMHQQQVLKLLEEQKEARIDPETLQALARRAEELGLDPNQIGLYADITSEAVNSRTKAITDAMAQEASQSQQYFEQQAQEARLRAEQETIATFQATHPDADTQVGEGMLQFLYDVGAAYIADAAGNEVKLPRDMPWQQKRTQGTVVSVDPVSSDVLEVAYEATKNPDLGFILRGAPMYYESDEGLEIARGMASQRARERGVTTQTTANSAEGVDAALAAAETLTGPSAPAPVTEEPLLMPSREVFFSK